MLVNLSLKFTKHIPSRRSPRGEGLTAFPKVPASPRFTLLGPRSRTLEQKTTFEVLSQGGQLSLACQVLQNSWDYSWESHRQTRVAWSSYFLCTLTTSLGLSSATEVFLFHIELPFTGFYCGSGNEGSLFAFSPLILITSWGW